MPSHQYFQLTVVDVRYSQQLGTWKGACGQVVGCKSDLDPFRPCGCGHRAELQRCDASSNSFSTFATSSDRTRTMRDRQQLRLTQRSGGGGGWKSAERPKTSSLGIEGLI